MAARSGLLDGALHAARGASGSGPATMRSRGEDSSAPLGGQGWIFSLGVGGGTEHEHGSPSLCICLPSDMPRKDFTHSLPPPREEIWGDGSRQWG